MPETTTEKDLVARWQTAEGERRAEQVFGRLQTGRPLGDMGLGIHDGRVDLRGILSPPRTQEDSRERGGWVVQDLGHVLKFEHAELRDLDLSGGRLEGLGLFNTTIANCRFDEARCHDWRLWGVDVSDCSFVRTDMRKAVLGPWFEGRGNVYRSVDFSNANLRSIVCPAATFVDCDFGGAQLAKIDFQSSSFIRCRFAGLLREVTFYDHGFKTGKPDPNPMEDIDFSEAELRMVEFRRLDLDRVRFPSSADHLILRHYRCVLEEALRELRADEAWSGLRAIVEHRLKWAGMDQDVGVFNRRDLVEMGGEEEAEFAVGLLRRSETKCLRV